MSSDCSTATSTLVPHRGPTGVFLGFVLNLLYAICYGALDSCRDSASNPFVRLAGAPVAARFRPKPIFDVFPLEMYFGLEKQSSGSRKGILRSASAYLVDGSLNPQIMETWGWMAALIRSKTNIEQTGASKAKQSKAKQASKHSKQASKQAQHSTAQQSTAQQQAIGNRQ